MKYKYSYSLLYYITEKGDYCKKTKEQGSQYWLPSDYFSILRIFPESSL